MKVSIAPQAVLQGAATLSALRGSLPTGSLPRLAEIGDQVVNTACAGLEDWWKTMATGTADDVTALHQLITTAATSQVTRDHQAAADIENSGDPMAVFRVS